MCFLAFMHIYRIFMLRGLDKMRELSVYFCQKCGYYAYFQLPRNAVCHRCHVKLTPLDIRYQDFMNLDYEERDRLISLKIIEMTPTLVQRICEPAKLYDQRELVGRLTQEISRLTEENQKLNQTVDWMHKTIWEQLRQTRELESRLKKMENA